ncbi:MAG: SpoIIE family protein phosphatase [Burkholderiaceae bacterium]
MREASTSSADPHWVVRAASATDGGVSHHFNEDSVCIGPGGGHAVIADGMGGEPAGLRASEWVSGTLSALIESADREEPADPMPMRPAQRPSDWICRCADGLRADGAVCRSPDARHQVAALWLHEGRAVVAHVGDSRVYRLRSGILSRLTRDHSLLEDGPLVPVGLVRRRPVVEPSSALLTQVLGIDERVIPAVRDESLRAGDLYLLCTDGLTGFVGDLELATLLSNTGRAVNLLAEDLVRAALDARATDNVTVAVIRLEPADASVGGHR